MKRIVLVVAVATLLSAGAAQAVLLGAGAYAGASIPVVQDDVKTGMQFGFRVPIGIVPLLSIEPFVAFSQLGDATETFGGFEYTRSGFDGTAFGANLLLGNPGLLPELQIFPYVGIGSETLTRSGTDDIQEVFYNAGLGVSIPLSNLSIVVRGELNILATGDTSRKFANVNGGLTYKLPWP
jgi:hypothetical protein